jgi:hypothetical protein
MPSTALARRARIERGRVCSLIRLHFPISTRHLSGVARFVPPSDARIIETRQLAAWQSPVPTGRWANPLRALESPLPGSHPLLGKFTDQLASFTSVTLMLLDLLTDLRVENVLHRVDVADDLAHERF